MIKSCYECGSTEKLKEFDEENGICAKCYAEQLACRKHYKQFRVVEPQINLITDHIYLGNEDAALSQPILEKHNITAICVCGSNLDTPFEADPKYIYVKYDIDDFPLEKIQKYFDPNFLWVEERLKEGRNVLFHCAAGISRSASFVIAYLMKKEKRDWLSAKEFVKARRNVICPNSGFQKQLSEYLI